MRRVMMVMAVAALATLALTAFQNSATTRPAAASTAVPPSYGHVFVLVGENKDITQITTSGKDPFIMNTLKPESAWFTGYNSVTTGSLADYIALTSGQFAACQRTGPCGRFDVPNIFGEMNTAGMSWQDWNESMPSNCYGGKSGSLNTWNFYKNGHNPSLFYKDINSGTPTLCSLFDVPTGSTGPNDMSTFNSTLTAGTNVPEYNFISPNGCEAGYQTCYSYDGLAPSGQKVNPIREYDHFLEKEIPAIQKSSACDGSDQAHTCLIVATFDEGGHTRGTPTMLAVTGQGVVPGSYPGYYDHYSVLKTIEDGWNLPCTNNACGNDYTDYGGVTRQAVDLPIF